MAKITFNFDLDEFDRNDLTLMGWLDYNSKTLDMDKFIIRCLRKVMAEEETQFYDKIHYINNYANNYTSNKFFKEE